MLDAYSVPAIFLGLAILSFPYGYIITNTVRKEINFSFPFFVMLPAYLAVGISTVVLISTAIPLLVSPYVLIIATIIGYIFAIRIFNSTRVIKNGDYDVHNRLLNYFKVELFGNGKRTFSNIFSLCIVAALLAFVMTLVIGHPWPPNGNALLDSYLTSLIVDDSSVIDDLPASTIRFFYPVGYDLVSANISVLFNIYPAEAVVIFAAFIVFVISCLLFSLTFILTRSLWISLPSALVIFSIFGLLGPVNSIDGLVSTLPYPAIFGLLSVISLILHLQLIQSNHSNPSIWKSLPLVVISLLSVYIIFPRFLTLEAIIILSYYTLILYKQSLSERKSTGERRLYFADYLRPTSHRHVKKSGKEKEIGTTQSTEPTKGTSFTQKTYIQNSTDKQALSNIVLSLLIIVGFTVPFFIIGLGGYYYKISIFSDPVYFEGTNIISDFRHSIVQPWVLLNSNIYLAALTITALGTSVLTILVTFKAIPLLIVYIVLFTSLVLSGFYLTSTILTIGTMGSLSFSIIAFSIWQIFETKAWIKSKQKIFATVIFVSMALSVQVPPISNNAVEGESKAFSQFDQFYGVGRWLDANVSSADRILNDRSLSGYYLDGFSVKNLTYNYPSDFTVPQLKSDFQDSSKELRMIQELNVVVWQNPNEQELIYPLLNYYNISYIVLLPDSESNLDEAERYGKRPFDNEVYTKYFDSYDFLQGNLSDSSSRIYRVK